MKNTQQNGNIVTNVLLGAAAIGLVIGFGAFSMMQKSTPDATAQNASQKTIPTTDTKAADVRVLLNALDREHVDLALNATRNGYSGAPDFDASAKQLDVNSVALASTIGSVYGADAEARFLEIWRSHINFFVDYTVASKMGDKVKMDQAVKNLQVYTEDISDFLSKANPNLPKDVVRQVITEHVGLLKGSVDSYAAGNYAQAFAGQHEANEHVGKIADTLAGAIVKQYPEKFK